MTEEIATFDSTVIHVDTRLDEELTGTELAARYPGRPAPAAVEPPPVELTPTAAAYLVYVEARDAQLVAHAAYVLAPRDRVADAAYTAAVQARETARDAYVHALKAQIEATL